MTAPTIDPPAPSFSVEAVEHGEGFRIAVEAPGMAKSYLVPSATQQDFSAFFGEVSKDFGTALPHILAERVGHQEPTIRWRPLLTENLHPQILVGYGDPAVFKDQDGYWLVATSNDAPDAFPVLHSTDLRHWEPKGFVFPAGNEPSWAAKGRNIADFWAPEMARAGDEYWLAFTARQASGALAIGIARSPSPLGPWIDNGAPLVSGTPLDTTGLGFDPGQPPVSGGVIDSHIFIDPNGDKYIIWKDDRNSIWPRPQAMLLRAQPDLIGK
jgi:arabinan endo-1,5-alpha-L-arabinosidase